MRNEWKGEISRIFSFRGILFNQNVRPQLRTDPDESTEMTLDESAYNVILMEDGNFILTQYEATAADDGTTTLYDVILPIDSESANIPEQNGEFIIQEIDEQIGCVYQKCVSAPFAFPYLSCSLLTVLP